MSRQLFGDEWYELLSDYLEGPEFTNIANTLVKLYSLERPIIPPYKSPLFFKAFRDLQPSEVKVVILGMDPYHQKDIYTGYAFDNANSLKLSSSLRNIFREIDRTYPENRFNLEYGNLDRWDLSRWVLQGVLLANTALTVIEGVPDSHTSLWRPFTQEWIYRLSEWKDDVIWLLWGNKAHEFEDYIVNKTHRVIKSGHPSPLNRTNLFVGSNCFVECNEDLKGRNKKEIIW